MKVSVKHDRTLIEEVAWSCRILAMFGYEDLTLGHVSARGSDESTIYIKRKGVALGEVTPQDIVNVDLHSYDSNGAKGMHLETVLHTEVYKRRPDVRAVVHGHPPYATAFGATDAEFTYLTHDSVFFIDRIATYDGVPNLIIDEEQGAAVAEALGSRTVLLLRNHGVLVAERDLRWVTLASALLERAVQVQAMARSIGPLHPIPDQMLQGIHELKYQPDFAAEYWEAWVRTVRRDGRALGMPEES